MAGQFLKELLDKMPNWFYHAAGLVFLAAIVYFFWTTFSSLRKLTTAISNISSREDRIQKLQDEVNAEKDLGKVNESTAHQVSSALFNIKSFVETLNEIRREPDAEIKVREALGIIERLLDQLANNIKTQAGEEHRCGVWIINDDKSELVLRFTSAGFPKHYKRDRKLNIHDSVAGRTFNKKQKDNIKDVKKDKDWKSSPFTENVRYTSLICIPVGDLGVLTIDGRKEMSDECELIGEVYSLLIEAAIHEYSEGVAEVNFHGFFEYPIDNEEEVG